MTLDLAPLLPLNNENRWSDLLATLITTDPEPARHLLSLPPGQVRVQREYAASKTDRPDLVIYVDDRIHTILEAKLLASVSPGQLDRYSALSVADQHVLTHLRILPVDTNDSTGWATITWEDFTGAYAASTDPWCARTAAAWTAHISRTVPPVDADTRWNDVPVGVTFATAMRTRMAWLIAALPPPDGVEVRLDSSASGDSAILVIRADTPVPQYRIHCAVEEALDVRDRPGIMTTASRAAKGPYVGMRLEQFDVVTSSGFNWLHLAALWPTLRDSGFEWTTGSPTKRVPHDKAGVETLNEAGVPKHLGRGFGEGLARIKGMCMFGPTFSIAPDSTLGEIVPVLERAAVLVRHLAAVPAPSPIG